MSNDCEVYVDPEEDEVFFGCISDREKSICARLSQQSGLYKEINNAVEDHNLSKLSNSETCKEIGSGDENKTEHVDSISCISKKSADDSDLSFKDANTTIMKTPERSQAYLNNTTVESEHNYSTPMKHKIDKTILTTPKSVVKADRDGGFLKVLSEIAIVKAEVEGDKKIEEEDKENKMIPDIIITEPTPDKAQYVSPPKSCNTHSRRFRIIYNSPKNEDNVESKNIIKKSAKDNFETCQNIINKSMDNNGKDVLIKDNRKSTELCNESINLIDLNDSNFPKKEEMKTIKSKEIETQKEIEEITKIENSDPDVVFIEMKNTVGNQKIESCKEAKKIEEITMDEVEVGIDVKKEILEKEPEIKIDLEEKHEVNELTKVVCETEKEIIVPPVEEPKPLNTEEVSNLSDCKTDVEKSESVSVVEKNSGCIQVVEEVVSKREVENNNKVEEEEKVEKLNEFKQPSRKSDSLPKPPVGIRFSKEARKIVELLKKSTDETINSTIDEVDESSFISPENVSLFDTTSAVTSFPEAIEAIEPLKAIDSVENVLVKNVLTTIVEKVVSEPCEKVETKTPKKDFLQEVKTPKFTPKPEVVSSLSKEKFCENKIIKSVKNEQRFSPKIKPPMNKLTHQPYTVEKDRHKFTPITSLAKMASVKYFSDRKINNQNTSELKKCVKKLPMEDKNRGIKDSNTCSSKIPVFGLKPSKIALPTRNTPIKTPTGKTYKNPKYKNIESPINAYINNKTTPLVQNVKPEVRKDGISKILKPQVISGAKILQERPMTAQLPLTNTKLPFVEYRSATPYKVEKRPESRLPRLAPAVQKLIGPNSPTVLKHEGRFYVKDAGKANSTNDHTVLGNSNEVSLLVSQTAQKTNTIK